MCMNVFFKFCEQRPVQVKWKIVTKLLAFTNQEKSLVCFLCFIGGDNGSVSVELSCVLLFPEALIISSENQKAVEKGKDCKREESEMRAEREVNI